MQPDDEVRLKHLREAAATALRFTEGRTRTDLDNDVLWATISEDLPALHTALDEQRD